ncbi:MAG TPA: polysaccharide biosynthesis/export family protein [Terracidiphilus sp.]|nr:polysaccharide biosynthesis/export family protein [Terracidiphilus sp.]
MRKMTFTLLAIAAAAAASAQQEPAPFHEGAGATTLSDVSNLPMARIGNDDLIGVTVYDAPELTRTVRVSSGGNITLPMVNQPLHAAGLYPTDLEKVIADALTQDHVLVDPVVTVSIVEYQSHPITVVGAVKMPVTFQATGNVTLLDAISRAQGLTENAGSEILVSRQTPDADGKPATLVQRIPVRGLLDGMNLSLNESLQGGEVIRVPEAGRIFIVGDVKKSGAFYITDGSESSVLKALALSEGLDSFSSHEAYIYRADDAGQGRKEIPIELKKIMDRKTPDVALEAGDILYVPSATGAKASLKTLETSLGIGTALGAAFIYYGTK